MRTRYLTTAVGVAVAIVAGGCGESAQNKFPGGSSPVGPSTFGVASIAGTVNEHTWDGRRQLPGAAVRLTVTGIPPWNERLDTLTDDNGFYAFQNVTVPSSATLALSVSGYNHVPCPRVLGDFFVEVAPVAPVPEIRSSHAARPVPIWVLLTRRPGPRGLRAGGTTPAPRGCFRSPSGSACSAR